MSTLRAGIVSAASEAAPVFDFFEADWRNSMPTDWALDAPLPTDTLVHSSTGTYVNGTNDAALINFTGTLTGDMPPSTLIIHLKVNAWSPFFASIFAGATDYYELGTYDDSTVQMTSLTSASQGTSIDQSLGTAVDTFVALSTQSDGGVACYVLKSGVGTVSDTEVLTPGSVSPAGYMGVSLSSFYGVNLGTPGDVRLVHTYVATGYGFELSDINTVVSSWGWTP